MAERHGRNHCLDGGKNFKAALLRQFVHFQFPLKSGSAKGTTLPKKLPKPDAWLLLMVALNCAALEVSSAFLLRMSDALADRPDAVFASKF